MNREIATFLHQVTVQRKNMNHWAFLHATISDPLPKDVSMIDVRQSIEFMLAQERSSLLFLEEQGEFLALINNDNNRPLSVLQKTIAESLPMGAVYMNISALNAKSIMQIAKSVEAAIPASDEGCKSCLRRMNRMGNTFLVLDDDPMVLKQMEVILKGYGHVECMENVEDFLFSYERYAPNAVFIDLHLKTERGTNLLKLLDSKLDPYAYSIIITADAVKNAVMEAKKMGADGFIVKPVGRETVYRALMKSPTFMFQHQVAQMG